MSLLKGDSSPSARHAAREPAGRQRLGAWDRFWYEPVPRARLSWFRAAAYGYVVYEVLAFPWHAAHALVSPEWYRPLWIGRLLSLPAPTQTAMTVVTVAVVALALVALAGRARRVAGPAVLLLYAYWCYVGFSYGKVDHDKASLLVALAVLPTVAWSPGLRGLADRTPDRAAGWALRVVQLGVVLVYLLSGVTKLRVSGLDWVTSSVLATAITRRGTVVGDVFLHVPWLLQLAQAGILAFELGSPLLLVRGRAGRAFLWAAIAFHAVTYATIRISFRPHLVCLLAFLPLERVTELRAPLARGVVRAGRLLGAPPPGRSRG